MKLVFCGTPDFAVPSLQALLQAGHEVALVLTQPDRPAGRKMQLQASAVKQFAGPLGLALAQPEKIKANAELRASLEAIRPDAIIVVAYGRIIPDWMLALPPLGAINVHGSLLPKYRGAAPVQWAVANGETETGVTTMQLDSGLDTGAVFLKRRLPIGPDQTATELFPALAEIGADLLVETLDDLARGDLQAQPQDHTQATLAPILTRDDGRLDFSRRTAQQTYDRWRGFSPWPGAHALFRGKRFLVHRLHPLDQPKPLAPGELDADGQHLYVGAAASTLLALDEVQLEGKPRLPGVLFARDFQLRAGEHLD